MTQELVSSLLGVRREGVTGAAIRLQRDGAIRYRRGHITVVDRPQLELRTCECYTAPAKDVDRASPARRTSSVPRKLAAVR